MLRNECEIFLQFSLLLEITAQIGESVGQGFLDKLKNFVVLMRDESTVSIDESVAHERRSECVPTTVSVILVAFR